MSCQLLGNADDDPLFFRLCEAVQRLGGLIEEREWALGSAREVTSFEIKLPDGRLEAIVDTEVGLSLSGPEALVARVAEATQITPPSPDPDAGVPPLQQRWGGD